MRTHEGSRPTEGADSRCCDRPPRDVEPEDATPARQPEEEPVPEEAGYGYGV